MSLQFSDTTNKAGIVQLIDDLAQSDTNTYPLAEKTRDINLALDRVFALIFQSGGTWQFDDSNHTDYPIITTDLVSGQRDYSFTSDETGNLILDVQRVLIKDSNGIFAQIYPVDVSSNQAPISFVDGLNQVGTPSTYDKNANGIFLDPIPDYNSTNGLKIYISREGSYFATTDTTKKAGFAGLFHEYLALRPAYYYALRKGKNNADVLKRDMLEMENAIQQYYKVREKDVQKIIRPIRHNSR